MRIPSRSGGRRNTIVAGVQDRMSQWMAAESQWMAGQSSVGQQRVYLWIRVCIQNKLLMLIKQVVHQFPLEKKEKKDIYSNTGSSNTNNCRFKGTVECEFNFEGAVKEK